VVSSSRTISPGPSLLAVPSVVSISTVPDMRARNCWRLASVRFLP
jgi:hypothetical protein